MLPKNNAIGNLYSSQFAKDVGATALNRQLRWPKNRNINTVTEPTSVARFRTTPSTETQAPISAQSFIQTSKLADDLDAQFNTWRKSQGLDDNTPITYDEIERFVDNSNDPLLLRNYHDFIDDLKKKSIYHETLSANDIQRELP